MSDNGKKEVRVWCDGWYVHILCDFYRLLQIVLCLTKQKKMDI